MKNFFQELFIFEMANNHQGDLNHALTIVKEMGKLCQKYELRGVVKLQYRDLDTFVHPDEINNKDNKHVTRFLSTRLKKEEFKKIVDSIKEEGMLAMVTPFDENSVDVIIEHNADIIKVASCSADDWPLLNKIAATKKPIIASTGGLNTNDIDNLVNFLKHKEKDFAIMHCVGIYPTPNEYLNIAYMEQLMKRYPDIPIGYSGHEAPKNTDVIKVAASKGAQMFERHVGVATDKITLNGYSMNPKETEEWIKAYQTVKSIIGNTEKVVTENEQTSLLSLRRGVFAKKKIEKGQTISSDDIFYAFPCKPGQLVSSDFGRLRARFVASKTYKPNEAIYEDYKTDAYYRLRAIINNAKGRLAAANIVLNDKASVELSHHFGIENFEKFGCLIVNLVNREYCKKIILTFPGQQHPEQRHEKKEETFHILDGELTVFLNKIEYNLKKGDILTVERGVVHSFYSEKGAIIEEVSTTHYRGDSFYLDPLIAEQDPMQRKTIIEDF